ncbi:hypothetical protein KAFR_0H00620 [Kazachstania africana CBS 2517]|uniref:Uncharacterized protein n=1 Tax=Kazachstania africana (strain ATCC 22294 / BCRC 22015 / CBS 2517 / CECT 1963 / NBRC 1671 / NRRL Y-8276) TaxID=1071382 RepID=H2AYR5_KAZAF|nr:hypothetical protein KAFR_0H00620 [Kazachstania africana CBS 2517]CCF59471.1 hypothetical protein KAFR_0H00620 [Kazachstania africana CBS 2517]
MSLNKEQTERFRDRHIRQEYELLHLLPAVGIPELSGLYLKSFYNSTKKYRLTLPTSITDANSKFCGTCGVLFVPTFNLSMKVITPYDKDDKAAPTSLQYECLNCRKTSNFEIEVPKKLKHSHHVDATSGKLKSETFLEDKKKVIKSSAKDRAKKRKMNSLSNLLNKKKKEDERKSKNQGSLSSLSLDSFMKR